MILECITLHNFGIYAGKQTIDLSPQPGRPVVLIGALNGGGKTTLLEALQIALFGRAARFLDKRRGSYIEYMMRSVNRAHLIEGASVGVAFSYRTHGRDVRYEVVRTWSIRGAAIDETLDVTIDGERNETAGERWSEFVEAVIPAQISDLFFFDGERIESLADPERSAELIRIGLHSLLGLDLVDDLSKSLSVLDNKLKAEHVLPQQRDKLAKLAQDVQHTQARQAELLQELASVRTARDATQSALDQCEQRFKSEGGELFEQHDAIKRDYRRAEAEREEARGALQELAADVAPLLQVYPRILSIQYAAEDEQAAQLRHTLHARLTEHDAQLVEVLRAKSIVSAEALAVISQELEVLRSTDRAAPAPAVPLGLVPTEVQAIALQLEALKATLRDALKRYVKANEALEALERRLAAVPDEAKLHSLIARLRALREQLRKESATIEVREADYEAAVREHQKAERRHQAYAAELIEHQFEDRLAKDMRVQLARSKTLLSEFRARMRQRHVGRLERLVTESFQQLMRKRGFVERVSIDMDSFELHIHAGSTVVPADKLSAGERQLLAVAVLWGLARASGRRLPTVVDTPLGRLDSEHRGLLVEHYFPQASHQVILLSTDEEVVGHYRTQLAPAIAREWLVEYDEHTRSSRVRPGYFNTLAKAA